MSKPKAPEISTLKRLDMILRIWALSVSFGVQIATTELRRSFIGTKSLNPIASIPACKAIELIL